MLIYADLIISFLQYLLLLFGLQPLRVILMISISKQIYSVQYL